MNRKPLKPPFSWFGGKGGRMRSKLLPLIPTHKVYVEPFGGSAAMLMAKAPSPVEVYNDLDSGLVNFFRVLRDARKFRRLKFLASLTPYSREEYYWARESWLSCSNVVDRAHRWFTVARMSFSGSFGASWTFSVTQSSRGMASCVSSYLSSIDRLAEVHSRLMRVQIEHVEATRLIDTYDTADTFFYLDPPYVRSTRRSGGYAHEMSDEDHARLVERLLKVKGKVLLSGYASPIYRPLEDRGWKRIDWEVTCDAAGRTRATGLQGAGVTRATQMRTESVWMNYST